MLARMSTFETDLTEALQAARRDALLAHVRDNPDVSLGELLAMGDGLGDVAASLTVRELLSGDSNAAKAPKGRRTRATRGAKRVKAAADGVARRRRGKGVNTRTADGREEFDQTVLELVRSAGEDGAKAGAIKAATGGTPLQIRTALHRLKAARQITRKGKARATVWLAK